MKKVNKNENKTTVDDFINALMVLGRYPKFETQNVGNNIIGKTDESRWNSIENMQNYYTVCENKINFKNKIDGKIKLIYYHNIESKEFTTTEIVDLQMKDSITLTTIPSRILHIFLLDKHGINSVLEIFNKDFRFSFTNKYKESGLKSNNPYLDKLKKLNML